MNKYHRLIIILCAVLLMGILAFAVFTGRKREVGADAGQVLAVNAIAKDAAAHWDNLEALSGKDYGADYVVLNLSDELVYASDRENGALTVETAMKQGNLYAYVIRNGQIVGSVILRDGIYEAYGKMRTGLILGLGLFCVVFLGVAMVYGSYVQRKIISPFQNMKSFAGKVAEGHLDEPLLMDRENLFGAFSESFDIMREQLKESRDREVALQKKERELVASLSHDLKTPITGVKLTTELLKAKVSAPDGTQDASYLLEKLDTIYKKADQMDALVSDLFSSTLDDLGEFTVSLRDEEAAVLGDLVKKYDDKGLAVMEPIPETLIRIDIRRMGQVIGNILINSYKYANTKIDVHFSVAEKVLQMKIADHGPGVTAEELDLITNKFYRGRQWKDGKESGSGLGLYIAKTLMEKMQGELIAESDGDGLCITLRMPLS